MPPSIIVLTGMSGAGKQLAARYFEDMGWRVIDNLPPRLLPALLGGKSSLCLVCDIRSGEMDSLLPAIDRLDSPLTVLFLDASDEALVTRFKETRRTHPLFDAMGGILPAIGEERRLLGPVKARADVVIDTTGLAPADLRHTIRDRFGSEAGRLHPITVTVASFGFKHGMPLDADLLFDVRFLNNPYYLEALRDKDGRDPEVEAFVMADERTDCFLERLYDLVSWTLPHYITEGKAYLTIGIGCTGGKHRSVVVARKLARFLSDRGYRALVQHRDVEKR